MAGDVGLVAKFLDTVVDFFTDPMKWERLSRESKLAVIREGLNAAIDANQWDIADKYMAAYRSLSEQTGV